MLKHKNILWLIFLLCAISSIHGREPYHTTVTINNRSISVSEPNLKDLKEEVNEAIIALTSPFVPLPAATLNTNLRGIIINESFAAGSTALVVNIPQAGITQTFDGGTREASLILLKDFIRDAGVGSKLLKAYARFSPIDPIAGNPNSLMALMAQADYLLGHLSPLSGCDCCWSAQPIVHQFQIGVSYGRAFSKGFDTTTITVPLRYSYSPNLSWALILDVPVTYNRNGGASSVLSSVGAGLRLPITWNWSITSIFRWGAGGSVDLCTSGSFWSTGLTSVYNYKIYDFVLSMTNYVGYISSTNLWLGGVNFNYQLHNWVFKNGLSLTSCHLYQFCGRPVNVSIYFEDTSFARERLFIKHFDEVGISLIINNINPCIDYDCLQLGFIYQFGQREYKGFFFNAIYQF